ncbi:hypothetical protein MED01_002339 [Micromonospora sp. MED01]|uniref:hypothetical protein n=1 Tax=Micromonospora alfalfae TaxID=2911212 RepID=UPI001EE91D4A|nr:hypothetical protein [Micromonospora alfalfae]MCG5464174.1 hypothetical protein [Micromonospora alfalfae]
MTTVGLAAMTQAAIDHRKTASNALNRANRLHEQLAAARNALKTLGLVLADLKADNDDLRKIVKAAEYQYGDLFCINGECDHAAELDDDAPEDAPCPLVEIRYATGAEITAITPLLMSADGDQLDDGDEIPVGEIRRVLGEARATVNV